MVVWKFVSKGCQSRRLREIYCRDQEKLVAFSPLSERRNCGGAALVNDSLQHSRHAPTWHTRICFQREAFPRKRVHHAEHPQPSPACGDIACKVNRPSLVRCEEHRPFDVSSRQPLAPDTPDAKPSSTIHALHAFVLDAFSSGVVTECEAAGIRSVASRVLVPPALSRSALSSRRL